MEYFGILEFFTDDSDEFEALDITSSCHDQRKGQNRHTQKGEQFILIDAVFIERVISEFTFHNAYVLELLNVPLYGWYGLRVSSAGILETHGDSATGKDTRIDAGNSLVIDLRDIVNKIVLLMHLLQRVLKDKSNQFWYLFEHIVASVADTVPQN